MRAVVDAADEVEAGRIVRSEPSRAGRGQLPPRVHKFAMRAEEPHREPVARARLTATGSGVPTSRVASVPGGTAHAKAKRGWAPLHSLGPVLLRAGGRIGSGAIWATPEAAGARGVLEGVDDGRTRRGREAIVHERVRELV